MVVIIFRRNLLPDEAGFALVLIRRCPEQAQALLDELSARMQARGRAHQPDRLPAWIGESRRCGEFVPELGQRVAATRRRRQKNFLSVSSVKRRSNVPRCRTRQRQNTKPGPPSDGEIRRMLDVLRPGRPPGKAVNAPATGPENIAAALALLTGRPPPPQP